MVARRNGENLAYRIHQQSEYSAAALQHQNVLGTIFRRQAQQLAETDGGQHVAAIVNQPAHKDGRQRNRLRARRAHNFENMGDGNAEERLSQADGTDLNQRRR